MNVIETELTGVLLIEPNRFSDKRGYLSEIYVDSQFKKHVPNIKFSQDIEFNFRYGVLYGLNYYKTKKGNILIHLLTGRVLVVVVDIRKESTTYGKYVEFEITEDNLHQVFIPKGYAHGFIVLSENAICRFKLDIDYNMDDFSGIKWNDPFLNIDWRVPYEKIIVSEKMINYAILNL